MNNFLEFKTYIDLRSTIFCIKVIRRNAGQCNFNQGEDQDAQKDQFHGDLDWELVDGWMVETQLIWILELYKMLKTTG